MNRRYFLGMALSAAAAPVAASPFFSRRTTERPRILSFRHLHTDEWVDVTYRIGDSLPAPRAATAEPFLP
jgi:hypothetical protein